MKLKFGSKAIDFRVSTLPTLFGEKIVIRILDPSSAKVGIEALGYEKIEKDRLLKAIARPYGMVLVTGPTGSGKTVSLYTCLNILNQPGVNISTVEDPAEINLPGVNQVNVNDKAGLTFSAALKSFLRQDPDIIMVGEIRDLETADIAMKAAQTGHMVMSTLHTNDAPDDPHPARQHGRGRLQHRRKRAAHHGAASGEEALRELQGPGRLSSGRDAQGRLQAGRPRRQLEAVRAVGCSMCNNGYKGRVGIYQVMPISEDIQKIILGSGMAQDIATQAQREGVRDLRQSGLLKVRSGMTTLEEVISVTNE
jgi:type IV pilus assembly protein PilB